MNGQVFFFSHLFFFTLLKYISRNWENETSEKKMHRFNDRNLSLATLFIKFLVLFSFLLLFFFICFIMKFEALKHSCCSFDTFHFSSRFFFVFHSSEPITNGKKTAMKWGKKKRNENKMNAMLEYNRFYVQNG